MKLFYLISGIVFFGFPIFWGCSNYDLLNLEKNGRVVKMKIIDKPAYCFGTYAHYKMKVVYNGKIFIKQIGGSICDEYKIGDFISMKYLPGSNDVLYPHESVIAYYIPAALLMLFGAYMAVKGITYKNEPLIVS